MLSSPDDQLRARGLRVTSQRLAVLRALEQHPHSTADALVDAVRTELGAVSRQAIYNVLGVLTEHGLIRRLESVGSVVRYDPRTSDHHHLVCRGCGATVDVDCTVDQAGLTQATKLGYRIELAEVTYWGQCPRCQQSKAKKPSVRRPRPR